MTKEIKEGVLFLIICFNITFIIGCLIVIRYNKRERAKNVAEEVKQVEVINNTKEVQINVKMAKKQEIKQNTKKVVKKEVKTQPKASRTYKLTHYGWDCCKSGKTATGYNVKNTIYYNDKEYGTVRIVAMCKNIPLYSIVKIKDYKLGGDITAIVIDRGVGCGTIDLLVENEAKSSKLGIQKNITVEILRKGK